jgi:hypothetical protein
LYNATSEQILEQGYAAYRRSLPKKRNHKDIFYVDNIIVGLNDIYLKKKQASEYNVHDKVILRANEMFLKRIVDHYLSDMEILDARHSAYHFALAIPTHWDYGIREELIRPLFVQAGLITKNDHHNRLLFVTRLESIVRYLQPQNFGKEKIRIDMTIGHEKEYIMYELACTNKQLSVNLNLFSTHYPSTKTIDNNFIPRVLNSAHFTVSFDS